jgi:hypothetical protein
MSGAPMLARSQPEWSTSGLGTKNKEIANNQAISLCKIEKPD